MWTAAGTLLACVWGGAGTAQTLPLPPGTGFAWEHAATTQAERYPDLTFDAGGTLWTPAPVEWLDLRGGAPGVWTRPDYRVPYPSGLAMLTLGPNPSGGLHADTILVAFGSVQRSTDGGRTWSQLIGQGGDNVLLEVPVGHPYAGRILAGGGFVFSDDRGATWSAPVQPLPPLTFYSTRAILSLPPPGLLPGVASGRATGVPVGWVPGRIVASGDGGGIMVSDDGGQTFRATDLYSAGLHVTEMVLVRRPDTHPLGPGPRLVAAGYGVASASSVWSSDDAGVTWQRRPNLVEPGDGPGWPGVGGLFALSEPGEADPGAGGRVLAVLGRGHLYLSRDAGDTWALVGRAPEMVGSGAGEAETSVGTSELGPDGRLYIGVSRLGQARGWLWRTTDAFAVAGADGPASGEVASVGVSVRPNPAGGRVEVVLTLAEAQPVRVVVLDALGREVAVVLDEETAVGERSVGVDTGAWPSGVYVVRATAGAQVASARLVVAR